MTDTARRAILIDAAQDLLECGLKRQGYEHLCAVVIVFDPREPTDHIDYSLPKEVTPDNWRALADDVAADLESKR